MKQIFTLVIMIFSPIIMTFSQNLTVDCGKDLKICVLEQIDTTFKIGNNVQISQGTAPYLYEWTCNYQEGQTHLSASAFLSDTSILNPYFKQAPTSNGQKIVFKLSVKDQSGSKATDSLAVYFYKYAYLTSDAIQVSIQKGDSVQLTQTFIDGGHPPLTYRWTPTTSLSASSGLGVWATPEVSTEYAQTVTDSLGCISATISTYKIQITTNNENLQNKGKLLNAYQQGCKVYFNNPFLAPVSLIVYTMEGKKVMELQNRSTMVDLGKSELKNSLYLYVLKVGNITETGKYIQIKN